jgi:uncharacterized protein with GYD domain
MTTLRGEQPFIITTNTENDMALFMLMGKYSPESLKAIMDGGQDREAAARKAIEAAGGKLLGFYGMFGQDYNVAVIVEAAGNAEYIGGIAPAITSGTFTAFKSIPLYTAAEVVKGSKIAKKVAGAYSPPAKSK